MDIDQWSDEQVKKIHDESDKPLFLEIIGCLNAGFLRSAYIMSWIAIAENLKNKILQSSNLGDERATVALQNIEDAESNKKSVDKIILDKVNELSLTDANEKTILEFLWSQRCVFAHPYEIAPSEDQVKHIIDQLVNICLSKPLLYKKNFLLELINNLVTKSFFLTGDQQKQMDYFHTIMLRVTEDLHPFLFKTLLFELGKIESDNSKSNTQLSIRYFLSKLLSDSPLLLSNPVWTLEQRAVNYPFTTFFGCVNTSTWPKLDDRVKEILVNYAVIETDPDKQNKIKTIFSNLIDANILENIYETYYFTFLSTINFANSIRFYGKTEPMHKLIISELDSGNYEKQNSVLEYLKSDDGSKFLLNSSPFDQRNIGKSLMFAARGNNWNINGYLANFPIDPLPPADLILGFLEGALFNRINRFYVDLTRFISIFEIAKNLPNDQSINNILELEKRLETLEEGETHHTVEQQIDYAKNKLGDITNPQILKASEFLDRLKNYEFKWPD
ncbi:hypothetical protein [Chryseobacterium sp.]|uniref:hypothetical protein n=1 Tax=Chryseobacterium sp. TaxID=1871047 RepID=UPI002FCA1D46